MYRFNGPNNSTILSVSTVSVEYRELIVHRKRCTKTAALNWGLWRTCLCSLAKSSTPIPVQAVCSAIFVITIIIVVISVWSMFVVVSVPFVLLCTLSLLLSYPFSILFYCLTWLCTRPLLFAMNYGTMFVIMIRRNVLLCNAFRKTSIFGDFK